jgi:hypothetical protein
MISTVVYEMQAKCDNCRTATATIETRNQAGKTVKVDGVTPDADGWLLFPRTMDHPGLHLCPRCVTIFIKLKRK